MILLFLIFRYIEREKGKNEDNTYYVDWVADPNLPKPMEMVVRLFVLLNSITELVYPAIVETLQDNLPHLASFLKNKDRANLR